MKKEVNIEYGNKLDEGETGLTETNGEETEKREGRR